MTESASSMHGEAQGAAPDRPEVLCDACARPFARRKAWQRFCGPKCRNDFHAAEARKEMARAAAPDLYEALLAARHAIAGKDAEHVWVNYPTEPALELGTLMDRALAKAGYRPEKPKG